MKKMDEIMELLTEEIDGFNSSINRLEQLTKNVSNIQIEARTWEVERLLNEYLRKESNLKQEIAGDIRNVRYSLESAKAVPKLQLWILIGVWVLSAVTILILGLRVSQLDAIRKGAYEQGRDDIVFELRSYFDENPEVYQTFIDWKSKIDSTAYKK